MVRIREEMEACIADAWEIARSSLAGNGDALCALASVSRSFIFRKQQHV